MREILFKAKRKDWRKLPKKEWWVEGDLIQTTFNGIKRMWISSEEYDNARLRYVHKYVTEWRGIEIDPDTLCQYTGLTDKNGQKIWENDIIEDDVNCYRVYWSKKYSNFSCEYVKTDEPIFKGRKWDLWSIIQEEEIYVKGNIFDNQELLEV